MGEVEPSEERRGRGGEGERERWEQCACAATGELGASNETSHPSPALPEACNCPARAAALSKTREKLPISARPGCELL